MQKVITINLNGNAYQLDEAAYEALRRYLDNAEAQLKDNPDKAEIVADLEQAIAEKCQRFLAEHKTVVATVEIEQILKEMGPVEPAMPEGHAAQAEPSQGTKTTADATAPKRLYRIPEGAMINGVCNGIAAYISIDPTIVRIIFVLLAILTKGAWGLVYIVLTVVIPPATTSEQRAAAHGLPFNAQELIDQAKRNYAEFKSQNKDWRREWRRQRRQWRAQWRATVGRPWWGPPPTAVPPGYATQVLAGIFVPIFSIINAALLVLLAIAIISLVNHGAVFGWPLPAGIPLWAGILILVLAYNVITSPLHLHTARHFGYGYGGYAQAWLGVWGGIFWLGFTALFFWLAYQHIPEVHDFIQRFPEILRNINWR